MTSYGHHDQIENLALIDVSHGVMMIFRDFIVKEVDKILFHCSIN